MSTAPETNIPTAFRHLECLGSGRTGSVHLVEEKVTGRIVALKLLSPAYSARAIALLREEFATLIHLCYPSLCAVFDFGATGEGAPLILREFIDGSPLRPGPPPAGSDPRLYLRPVLDALAALAFLHHNGVAHLDLHAGNVIERSDGTAVLIDVGVFPPQDAESDGRPRPRGALADIYAVGLLLSQRLTGSATSQSPIAPVAGWNDRLILHLDRIVARALSADPETGFSSAEELLASLCEVLGLSPTEILAAGESYRFVGQAKALEAGERLLDRLAHARGGCLWVCGGPGAGKTRFLAELRSRGALLGLRTEAFRFFPHEPSSLAALEQVLLGGRQTSIASAQESLSPEAFAHRIIGSLVGRSGERPLLVTVDDFQNADHLGASFFLACLDALAAGGGPTVGLCVASLDRTRNRKIPSAALPRLTRPEAHKLLAQFIFPVKLPAARERALVASARGNPELLRRAVCALKQGSPGSSPSGRELLAGDGGSRSRTDVDRRDPVERQLLQVLSIFARPVTAGELGRATGLRPRTIRAKLADLAGIVTASPRGRRRERAYFLSSDSLRDELLFRLTRRERRQLHLACARAIAFPEPLARDASSRADLVRHLVGAGKIREASDSLDDAVGALLSDGNAATACRIISLVFDRERSPRRRTELALRLSELARQSGQNELGRRALAAVLPRAVGRARLAILCRLGVHATRLGRERQALRFFRRALGEADPKLYASEIVETSAELADLQISRGDFEGADAARRRGLALLAGLGARADRAARQSEVTLRAISGRLCLRRFALREAIGEFRKALALARAIGERDSQALILNNLALAHAQLNEFRRAQGSFLAADRLARRSGNAEARIHIACNLALVAVKAGDAAGALAQLECARALQAETAGERLRFLLLQTESFVALTAGLPEKAAESGREAIRLGKRTGELPHVRFLQVYQAEALLECGRYDEAERILRRLARGSGGDPPALARMVGARLAFVLAETGDAEGARKILEGVAREPRAQVAYLEAWDDYFVGRAQEQCGDDGRRTFFQARERFAGMGVPFWADRCAAALLGAAVCHQSENEVRPLLRQLETREPAPHPRLRIETPLACAEACILLGEAERARFHLVEANNAIVGKVFPELDLRLEAAWARLALIGGDMTRALQHLHRARTVRSHIAEQLGQERRRRFLAHAGNGDIPALEQSLMGSPAEAEAPVDRDGDGMAGLVAHSVSMRRVVEQIRLIGPKDISVLVSGPSGSGKDLVAQAIHDQSPRRGGPYVVIHIPSIQEDLFEAELFGVVRGAFTGADDDRAGLLASAHRGTVCLDGIESLAPSLQAKLLRVLEGRAARPVGGTEARTFDVRFLFCASLDLRSLIAEGRFRDDFYWRLAQSEIAVPPLGERADDLPELVHRILLKHARLGRPVPSVAPDVFSFLAEQSWPGNVRQLETVLLRTVLAGEPGDPITVELLSRSLSSSPERRVFPDDVLGRGDLKALRRELEAAWLRKRFLEAGGSMAEFARAAGLSRSALYTRLRRLGVDTTAWRAELKRRRPE